MKKNAPMSTSYHRRHDHGRRPRALMEELVPAGLFINHDLAVTKCDILDKRDGIYKEPGIIHFDRR